MKITLLTLAQVHSIHIDQINTYGGIHGIRDMHLFDSAIHYPQSTFDGQFMLPDIYHMAAGYLVHIVKNHPFIDGNKRTGMMTAITFLGYNDIYINATNEEIYTLVIQVASSQKVSEESVAQFFREKII